MKKLIIFTTLMVMAFAIIANANVTRVQTMGNNDQALLDVNNIFQYYSRVNDYGKWAVGEFGYGPSYSDFGTSGGSYYPSNDFRTFGITWQFGSDDNPWVLGTFFHNSDTWYPSMDVKTPYGSSGWAYLPFDESLLPNQRIDIFYGRKFGATPFGFHLGIVNSSQTGEDDGEEYWSEGLTNYSLGFGLTLNEGKFDIAGGVDYLTWTDKGFIGAEYSDESKPAGTMSFWASGRFFHQANEQFTFVPHASLAVGSGGYEWYASGADESLDETWDLSRFGFTLGSGLQWAPSQEATCVLDFGFQYDKVTGEYTNVANSAANSQENESTFTLPYFKMGAEGKVFDWLWARFGSTSYWNNQTYEDETDQDKWTYNWPHNETMVGLGFVFNRLHVDCNVNPQLFLDGFNFISGRNNDMNFNFTMLYDLH